MEIIHRFSQLFLHLDLTLNEVIQQYGAWTYGLLFVIVFCETGLVVTPILPGDSLLFAAGTFAAAGSLRMEWLVAGLIAAAVAGDALNYAIGSFLGPRVWKMNSPFLKRQHLERTQAFYARYGGKTIVIARFVPIVRTFAPFLAGVGRMTYWRFGAYNIAGGAAWVMICLLAGYFFGGLDVVRRNFSLVILAICLVSVLPAAIEFLRHRSDAANKETGAPEVAARR